MGFMEILQRREIDEEVYRMAVKLKIAYRGLEEGKRMYLPKVLENLHRYRKRLYALLGEAVTECQREDITSLINETEKLISLVSQKEEALEEV